MFKHLKSVILGVVVVFLLLIIYFWWNKSFKPVITGESATQSFLITKGSGATQIANKLGSQGLIRSPLAFRFYVQMTGVSKKIQAGEYELSPSLSLIQIVDELNKGPKEIWVTIPEGLRREEIVEKFIVSFSLSGEKAMNFRTEFLALTQGDEGYLFPDTYLLPKTTPASKVVGLLKTTFNSKFATLSAKEAGSKLTSKEVVVLASLLERETITEEEKPIVAGIILKRLEADWPLQIDASIQYVVGSPSEWWPILTKENIEVKSAYNTYKGIGLPPAPIASPGLSSLEAVLDADMTTEYWFYIHDTKGQIHYGKTIEEHNENVRKYLGK